MKTKSQRIAAITAQKAFLHEAAVLSKAQLAEIWGCEKVDFGAVIAMSEDFPWALDSIDGEDPKPTLYMAHPALDCMLAIAQNEDGDDAPVARRATPELPLPSLTDGYIETIDPMEDLRRVLLRFPDADLAKHGITITREEGDWKWVADAFVQALRAEGRDKVADSFEAGIETKMISVGVSRRMLGILGKIFIDAAKPEV